MGGSLLASASWHGQIAELRIWNVAFRAAEIETNRVVTLLGTEPGLVAYYPFNEAQGETARDNTGAYADIEYRRMQLEAVQRPIGRLLNNDGSNLSAPMLICAEYSRLRVNAQNRKSSIMLRCLAIHGPDGVRLFDEQHVEELDMKWIGNAQIKPTLLGYIEKRAPPVPTENLTEDDDYNGATSVELIQSSDMQFSWTHRTGFQPGNRY